MNLYVGNLAREVTEDDLKEAFAAFGEVESVNIIKDRFSGESRGFGFVQMPSKEEAAKAIEEADGMDLKGRSLKVSEAHQKSGGGGGGGGGRGRGGKFGGPRGGGGRSGGPRGGGRGGFSRDRGGRDDRQGGGNRRF